MKGRWRREKGEMGYGEYWARTYKNDNGQWIRLEVLEQTPGMPARYKVNRHPSGKRLGGGTSSTIAEAKTEAECDGDNVAASDPPQRGRSGQRPVWYNGAHETNTSHSR